VKVTETRGSPGLCVMEEGLRGSSVTHPFSHPFVMEAGICGEENAMSIFTVQCENVELKKLQCQYLQQFNVKMLNEIAYSLSPNPLPSISVFQ
jgi:hypothetical protein